MGGQQHPPLHPRLPAGQGGQQGVPRVRGLRLQDVRGEGPQAPRAQGLRHGVERDQPPAPGVDQDQPGAGEGQGAGVDQVRRLRRQGAVQGQAVAPAQEVVQGGRPLEGVGLVVAVREVGVVEEDAQAEGDRPAGHRRPDPPQAHHPQGGPRQAGDGPRPVVAPAPGGGGAQGVVVGEQAPPGGEEEGQGVVGHLVRPVVGDVEQGNPQAPGGGAVDVVVAHPGPHHHPAGRETGQRALRDPHPAAHQQGPHAPRGPGAGRPRVAQTKGRRVASAPSTAASISQSALLVSTTPTSGGEGRRSRFGGGRGRSGGEGELRTRRAV